MNRLGAEYIILLVDEVLSVLVCAFELIATILTAIRCIMALWSQTHRERRFTKNIMFFMFREGLVYFGLVFGFTCAAAVLNFVVNAKMSHEHHHHWHPDSTLIVNQFLGKLLNAFTLPLSSLLSARLLLDLREWNERQRIMVSQDDHAWHFPSSEYNLNGPSKGSGKQPSSRRSPRSGGLGIESARVPGSANCASGRSAGSARSVRYGDSLGPWEVARREDVGGVRAPVGAENIELDDLSARASSAFEDEFGKDPFETVHRLDDARWIDPETMISDIVEYQKDDSRDQASKEVQGADIPEVTVTHVDGPEVFATRRCDNGRHSPGGLSALLSALQVGSRASSPTGSRRRLSPSPTPSSREGEDEDRFRDVSMGQAV
ncbi:hypothetical protein CONPUDRAFT_90887 [Coniophora puteana RWD-64-598 SS2]|uniref:Uncharacterized protein n=1 Tax=Coniophora puteana (strain RWD-64-598) TaxID=741705 RepID=A0A5M3MKD8_CONPW|nr:uncharacterized protein CONPUDRAFT_90887 [Coniophora puteana RWD-64-598 SS2]EIW79487.1 hypothetical protein CONPUDRAFT_90887 [Coniophora puteana RWD-64-598 SS2]